MIDDIRWLFARGGMGHFIEIKEHMYRNLTLEFLSTLHVEVTRRSQCQAGYISFYLQGQFYEYLEWHIRFSTYYKFTELQSPSGIQS